MLSSVAVGLYLRTWQLSTLLVKRQHHSDPVPQGKVIPGDVETFSAFVRPGCADARPDFLTGFVFTRVPAVVENIRWGVWH